MSIRRPARRSHRPAVLVCIGALIGAVLGAGPAFAQAEGGVLWIHGAGSTFSGPGTIAVVPTSAGGTATYTIEVVNEGPSLAQFNVRLAPDGSGETQSLAAGTLVTTPLAAGPDGYFTSPIAPNKAQVLTLKVTTPKTAVQTDMFSDGVSLYDTAGNFIDQVYVETDIKATTGTGANDLYTSTTGSPAVIAEPGIGGSYTAAEPAKLNGKVAFTVKLQNDGPAAVQISTVFGSAQDCAPDLALSVLQGTADVTGAILSDTYVTPLLAHGKSVTLTFKITYNAPASTCPEEVYVLSASSPGSPNSYSDLIPTAAAMLPSGG